MRLSSFRLQIILVSRLVLQLSNTANIHHREIEFSADSESNHDPPVFGTNSILGNIGGPLRTFSDDDDDDNYFQVAGETCSTIISKRVTRNDDLEKSTKSLDDAGGHGEIEELHAE